MNKVRYCIAIAAALLFSTVANAQYFEFGVKGGFAASWIVNTVVIGDEIVFPHNNFYAGGYTTYDSSNGFIMQAELLYAGKGYSDRSELRGKYSRSLSYLQVPLFAGYRFYSSKYTIMAGPEFGYLINSTTSTPGQNINSTSECNRFNIALALQTNYMLTDNIGVDVKFSWGANRTFAPDMYAEKVNDNGRNVSVQIGVNWMFY